MPTPKSQRVVLPTFDDSIPPEEVLAGAEDESDLDRQSPDTLSQAMLWNIDWTTETLMAQVGRENIDLDPTFQRRDVWNPTKKSRFIESLFLGLPIPQIVLAERKETRGSFIVLDGKQRILTLTQFMNGGERTLKLQGLTVLRRLEGHTYESLQADPAMRSQVAAFQNHTMRAAIFRQWPTEDFLRLVFYRLNSNTVSLSPQELRQALYPGPFTRFANSRSASSKYLNAILGQSEPDFRMRDVELFVRYFANVLYLDKYTGNMKQHLDNTCRWLNQEFDNRRTDLNNMAIDLDESIHATEQIFQHGAFSIWRGDRYEPRFNRTVYDLMTHTLSSRNIREEAIKRSTKLRTAFESLCDRNEQFVRAMEVTTKSLESTRVRFREWSKAASKALGITVQPPNIGGVI